MSALTLAEARERADLLTVVHTEVALDVTDPTSFRSVARLQFTCATPGASTFVDVKASTLVGATLNGRALDVAAWRDGRLPLTDLDDENVLVVDGLFDYSHDGEGLHAHVDPADERRYLYAMSFLDAAPRWFACFDQPDLKSHYRFTVTAPTAWRVLGNGPSRVIDEVQGARTWEVTPAERISTYLTTLAAGEWESVTATHDDIGLGVHVRASQADDLRAQADEILDVTRDAFDAYHRLFGIRYPFGEYHQVFVPDFNAGAMENPGCVLLRDSMIFRGAASRAERAQRAGTIAHELAHMWFGDLVTMAWWDDLWLNESFAEYMAHRVVSESGRFELWTAFGMGRKLWGGEADRSPSTHPVAASGAVDTDAALSNFDGISYAKGAALLKQLAKKMGDDVFFAGLRRHFADFAFGNACMEDLLVRWEQAGAHDLRTWAQAWLTTTGMDTITVAGDEIVVAGAHTSETPREHAVDVVRLQPDGTASAATAMLLREGGNPAPRGEGWLVPDAGDDAWAVLRLVRPGDDVAALPAISRITEPATRVAVWGALRWAVRDALADPREVLELVCREAAAETDDAILDELLSWSVATLSGAWLPADERVAARDRLAHLAAELRRSAEPGSDRALTLLRTQLGTSHDPAWLRDFLDGAEAESRDPRLRWLALTRVAELTGDTTAVDAELEVDSSAQARINAARARAVVPTQAAKESALAAVLVDDALAPHELYAIADGLFRAEQASMLEQYAIRWFEGLDGLHKVRRGWVLGKSVQAAFPDNVATPEVLAAAERALTSDLAPAVRRVVIDGIARLRLMVAAHTAFPGSHAGHGRG